MLATMAAAVIFMAPVKPYVRIHEPVRIAFVQTNDDRAAEVFKIAGPSVALEVEPTANVLANGPFTKDGVARFHLFTIAGKELAPPDKKAVTAAAALWASSSPKPSTVDLAQVFPQIEQTGTYILTWRTTTPLVIETLPRPIPQGLLEHLPADQKGAALAHFSDKTPVIIHIEALSEAVIDTDAGPITATFLYADAPHTIDNFIRLARQHFYDGSVFHRIIKGFMIQGGDSLLGSDAGTGGPGYQINGEFSAAVSHVRGILSMARAGYSVDSAGSQFFIMQGGNPALDDQYAAFGRVIDGMAVVDKIADTPVSDANGTVAGAKPVMKSVKIVPAPAQDYGIKE